MDGALFLAALVANCFLGAFPPVDLRAVCLVRAILHYNKENNVRYGRTMNEQCTYYHIRRQTCLENTVLDADWLACIRIVGCDWSVEMLLSSDWSALLNLIGQIQDRALCALDKMFRNVALQTAAIP